MKSIWNLETLVVKQKSQVRYGDKKTDSFIKKIKSFQERKAVVTCQTLIFEFVSRIIIGPCRSVPDMSSRMK